MSVAPDLLLQSSPQLKPAKAPVNRPEKPAERAARRDDSFAQVYASERKVKAAETRQGAEPADKTDAREPDQAASGQANEPVVAESGKSLPAEAANQEALTEEPSGEPLLDPLLMLGITLQSPVAEDILSDTGTQVEALAEEAVAESEELRPPAVLLQGPVVPSAVAVKLNEIGQNPAAVAAQDMAVIAGQTNVLAQQAKTPTAAERVAEKASDTPALNVSIQLPTSKTAESLASDPALALARLAEADTIGLDGKAEQSAELRAEGIAGKLSQLTQAISQQAGQGAKLPLVPGQPLAMNQPGWSEAAVDRVMWLSSQNLKSAEIQLDPANLGRMEVRIQMTQEQTQVTFSSPHAHVREALESQANRLRELFTQQGMNQLDVNVSDQSLTRGWQGQGQEGERRGQRAADDALLGDVEVQHGVIDLNRSALKSGRGLVDYYA